MITLKLNVDGKQKEFKQSGVTVRAMRELMKFQVKMDKASKGEEEMTPLDQIDAMVMIITQIFSDPEVNFDNVIDGLNADELENVLTDVFTAMGGGQAAPAKKVKKTSQK